MFNAIKSLVPEFHLFMDEEHHYNMGATWTDPNGLQDYHNVRVCYQHNSEQLALQGDPQPDGSWMYTNADGTIHTISAERASKFMEQTQQNATLMMDMLSKLQSTGQFTPPVDTEAQPA